MIGKKVWIRFGNTLRFGKVAQEKMVNGWKYVSVKWIDDEVCEAAIAWKAKMRGKEYEEFHKQWYRVNEVVAFEPKKMIKVLKKL